MHQIINVLLIGCGKIGGGSLDKDILDVSHSASLLTNPNYRILAIVDHDLAKAEKVANIHNCRIFGRNINIIDNLEDNIDLAVIASPTNTHELFIKNILKKKIKNIFCEKPMCSNLFAFKNIIKDTREKNINLIINYPRRWDIKLLETILKINKGRWGSILSIHGTYNGSLLNIGSHMIDLINLLYNEYTIVDKNMMSNSRVYCFENKNKIPLIITEIQNQLFPIFEITIFCEKASIRFFDNTKYIGIKKIIQSKIHKGEKTFDKEIRTQTDFHKLLDLTYDNILKFINDGIPIQSNEKNAFLVHKTIEEINNFKN